MARVRQSRRYRASGRGIVIGPPSFEAPMGSATLRQNIVTGLAAGKQAFVNLSPGFTVTLDGNNW